MAGHIESTYLRPIFTIEQYVRLVNKMARRLQRREFEAIAFRGTSGAAMAYPLSLKLKKPLICVRKDGSHSSLRVEGAYGVRTYVIVDDLIDTGATMDKIIKGVKAAYVRNHEKLVPQCVGIFLYSANYSSRKDWKGIPVTKI